MRKTTIVQWFIRLVKRDMEVYDEDMIKKQEIYHLIKKSKKN